jgi:TRAP-type C4-dicarboxylate transport system permease small subunit
MGKLKLAVIRISRISEISVRYTLVGMVALMTVLIIIQVFLRYLFLFSLSWSEEIARYLMIWVSFLGASLALKYGMHVGVEFFVDRASERRKKNISMVAKCSMLLFLIFFTIGGFQVAWAVRDQDSPALVFSMLYAYLSAPVGGVFMIIQLLNSMVDDGRK